LIAAAAAAAAAKVVVSVELTMSKAPPALPPTPPPDHHYHNPPPRPSLQVAFYDENCKKAANVTNFGMWLTFFTLYNNFVPISLYVTIEMVNYLQAYFIDQDRLVSE